MNGLARTYYITSRQHWPSGDSLARLKQRVQEAIKAGVDFVQVREKDLSSAALRDLCTELSGLAEGTATRLLVNGRADVAVAAGAAGVHLAAAELPLAGLRHRLPQLQIIGVSCHNEKEVEDAVAAAADYVLLGPIFETPSKPGAVPLGLERLAQISSRAPLPVYALGGLSRQSASACISAGAAGIAGIRLFQEEQDLRGLISEIRRLGLPR